MFAVKIDLYILWSNSNEVYVDSIYIDKGLAELILARSQRKDPHSEYWLTKTEVSSHDPMVEVGMIEVRSELL